MSSDERPSQQELHEQLETAIHLLEHAHGMALEDGAPGRAYAFNEALKIVEDAIDEKFKPMDECEPMHESVENAVERSKQAREKGRAEATLRNMRYSNREFRDADDEKYKGLLARFFP